MKWKYYTLADNDPKAKSLVVENLSVGAPEHTLSRKLLSRFSRAAGTMRLIAMESLDLGGAGFCRYAAYCGDTKPAGASQTVSWMDSPRWGLIHLVNDWLGTSEEALVLCENCFARREHVLKAPRESKMLFYGEEVYHILTNENVNDSDTIECALRESEHQWGTGVCSRFKEPPEADIQSVIFFDSIVENVAHIFVPALDGEAYLVWSRQVSQSLGSKLDL